MCVFVSVCVCVCVCSYVIEDVNLSAMGPCDGNAVPDCQRPIDFLSEVCD